MPFSFGDGYDMYSAFADAFAGYWDSGAGTPTLIAGRFAGSQALRISATSTNLVKSSGANDGVHHLVVAFRQTAALSGTTLGLYLQLSDAATNQCCVVFRSDGAILLTSATPAGTVLDTYAGAVTASNTWFAFEFEITINNTTGSWAVRKNGNTVNDRATGSLNTRPGANAYANKLTVGMQAAVSAQDIDDTFWQSGAASGNWLSDIRCYTRMPASDASTQFARSPTSASQSTAGGNNVSCFNGTARYTPFVAAFDGTVGTITINMNTAYTGNMKCSIFANAGGLPTTVIGSATSLVNAPSGSNTFTFGTPITVSKGTQYWIGFDTDSSNGSFVATSSASSGFRSNTAYVSFPVASPGTFADQAPLCTIPITITTNNCLVNETLQDGTTTYVYDSTVGHADFYNIAALGSTPASVVAVTTRGFMQKSDAGARTGAVQIKSGATTVASPTLNLSTSFLWAWRTDAVNPATGAAWTAGAVDAVQVGPAVVA